MDSMQQRKKIGFLGKKINVVGAWVLTPFQNALWEYSWTAVQALILMLIGINYDECELGQMTTKCWSYVADFTHL